MTESLTLGTTIGVDLQKQGMGKRTPFAET